MPIFLCFFHFPPDTLLDLTLVPHYTLSPLFISLFSVCSFHPIGLLVLFVQDIGDICLETAKTAVYLKVRNGVKYRCPEVLADVMFAIFTLQWSARLIMVFHFCLAELCFVLCTSWGNCMLSKVVLMSVLLNKVQYVTSEIKFSAWLYQPTGIFVQCVVVRIVLTVGN